MIETHRRGCGGRKDVELQQSPSSSCRLVSFWRRLRGGAFVKSVPPSCIVIMLFLTTQRYSPVSDSAIGARWRHSSRPTFLPQSKLLNEGLIVTRQQSVKPCVQSSSVFRNFTRVDVCSCHQFRTDRKFLFPSISSLGGLLKCAKNKLLLRTSLYAAEPPSEVVTSDKEEKNVTKNPTQEDKKQSTDVPKDVQNDDDVVVPEWFIGTRPMADTGWERLKDVFEVKEDKTLYYYDKYSREAVDWINVMGAGFIMGFVYGGVPAARHARLRYIELSHTQVYHGRREAVGDAHKAAHRGLIRYGYRWGWRVAVFAGIFHGVSTCLAVYRDKDDALNYSAAGALSGGLYKISLGLRGIIGGTFLGILMGVPTGLLIQLGQTLQGETYVQRRRRLRKEIIELRKEEWKARLQLMDDFITDATSDQQSGVEPSSADQTKLESKAALDKQLGIEPSSSSQTAESSKEQKKTEQKKP